MPKLKDVINATHLLGLVCIAADHGLMPGRVWHLLPPSLLRRGYRPHGAEWVAAVLVGHSDGAFFWAVTDCEELDELYTDPGRGWPSPKGDLMPHWGREALPRPVAGRSAGRLRPVAPSPKTAYKKVIQGSDL